MVELLKSGNLDDRLDSITEVVEELQNSGTSGGKSGGLSKKEVRELYARISKLEDKVEELSELNTSQTEKS